MFDRQSLLSLLGGISKIVQINCDKSDTVTAFFGGSAADISPRGL